MENKKITTKEQATLVSNISDLIFRVIEKHPEDLEVRALCKKTLKSMKPLTTEMINRLDIETSSAKWIVPVVFRVDNFEVQ